MAGPQIYTTPTRRSPKRHQFTSPASSCSSSSSRRAVYPPILPPAVLSLGGWFKWLPVLGHLGQWRQDRVCPLSSADIESGLALATPANDYGHRRVHFAWDGTGGDCDCHLDIIVDDGGNGAAGEIDIMCCILHDRTAGRTWVSTLTMLQHTRYSPACGPVREWDAEAGQVVPCCDGLYGSLPFAFQSPDAGFRLRQQLREWIEVESDETNETTDEE
ncbi:hypothetical protein N3K66_008915 [Trichothecium roseum]|uniref:Uncharacterized protein n=1 Tax=Trichothecium roseum TaxID=47278 RepID=A0ACC0URL4_9HYPO|nr:hypothetical protein N3K66_008915 [Trichothecium roseum]